MILARETNKKTHAGLYFSNFFLTLCSLARLRPRLAKSKSCTMTRARFSGVGASLTFLTHLFLLLSTVLSAFDAEEAEPDLIAFEMARVDDGGTNRVGSCCRSLVACSRWSR